MSQNIYIFISDIQSKIRDLKFGDKHWNFMQMAIPVTVFHVFFLRNAQKLPTKINLQECTLFAVLY